MKGIKIIADFEKDLKFCIRENILSLGNKGNSVNLKEFGINDNIYWNSKTIKEILSDYYNFIDRIIIPLPREVKITDNIQKSIYFSDRQEKINEIQKKFTLGENVNEYLSTKHTKHYKHRDTIFHSLGLHHLHINDTLPNGKIDKDKSKPVYLLIIQIDEKNVYFLDIILHKDFDDFDYIKYAKTLNREGLVNNKYLHSTDNNKGFNICQNFTPEELRDFRYYNVSYPIVDGDTLLIQRPRLSGDLFCSVFYVKNVMLNLEFFKNKYLNIIGIHNLLLQKNQYPKDVEGYELKIKWGNLDLLRGIEFYLYADGLLIHRLIITNL